MAYCKAFIFQGDYHVDDYIVYKYPGRLFFQDVFEAHAFSCSLLNIIYRHLELFYYFETAVDTL